MYGTHSADLAQDLHESMIVEVKVLMPKDEGDVWTEGMTRKT
jgi:hypothetical protein